MAASMRTTGTGQWILHHPRYKNWRAEGGILWIQGKGELKIDICKQKKKMGFTFMLQQDLERLSYRKYNGLLIHQQ